MLEILKKDSRFPVGQRGRLPRRGASSQLAASRLISTPGPPYLKKAQQDQDPSARGSSKPAFLPFLLLSLVTAISLIPVAQAAGIVRLALEHEHLTAADLARVIPEWKAASPGELLGFAPLPGIDRRVPKGQLLGWGKRLGLDLQPESLPDAVLVFRRIRQLAEAEAKAALAEAIAERHGLEAARVKVKLHDFEASPVPTGALRFETNIPLTQLNEPRSVPLRWKDGGGRSATIWLRATVAVVGTYAVAGESLPAGETLKPEDFVFQTGPLPGNPKMYAMTTQ